MENEAKFAEMWAATQALSDAWEYNEIGQVYGDLIERLKKAVGLWTP